MGQVWGEFGPDPKQLEKTIMGMVDEIADLIVRVKALEEQIGQTAIITTAPIGGFQPRNRRFNV